nr:alcohol dehydrogenase catalytic domain-containing protein [Gammaproteobacteria bacterium]
PITDDDTSLIRIEAAGICGSDMHAYHGHDARRVPPLILGHELSGVAHTGPHTGKTVALNPMITCDSCRDCLAGNPNLCAQRDLLGLGQPGGFAQWVSVKTANVIPLSETLSTTVASLMEPTAVSLHAIRLAERALLRPLSECRTLVIGGGAIGLLAGLILKHKGARTLFVAETNALRRATVQRQGIEDVYDPINDAAPAQNTFDLVVDAVGSGATRRAASELCRAGGVISHIGLQDNEAGLDTRRLTLQEIVFIGNYTYNPIDLWASLQLLEEGALGDLSWVESRPLSDGANAFEAIHNGSAAAAKIVLHPN